MKKIIIITMALLISGLNTASFASTTYNKGAGTHIETIIGVVESVNPSKNVFVVYDRDEGRYTTVLTDSKTIASLSKGQMVRVTLNITSPMAQSVVVLGH